MAVTRLRGRKNCNFPPEKEVGDATVLAAGDIFCWDGYMWQLIGGMFIPAGVRNAFLSYISNGMPDPHSLEHDLELLFNTPELAQLMFNQQNEQSRDAPLIDWPAKFKKRVLEVARTCEKSRAEARGI